MRVTPLHGSALGSIEVKAAPGQTFFEPIAPEVGLACYALDLGTNRVTPGIIGDKNTFGYMVEFDDGIRECTRFFKRLVTQEEYDALESGEEYIHPDGTRAIKK